MTKSYLEVVEPLLRSFRKDILKHFGNVEQSTKVDGSFVTHLDRSIEQRAMETLRKEYPNTGFLGEEHGHFGQKDCYWLFDPIDGTQNFIRGIDAIGVIIGLVKNGEVVWAAVYEPISDVIYAAEKGGGAFANGLAAKISERPTAGSFVDVVMSGDSEIHPKLLRLMSQNKIDVLGYYGAAYRTSLFLSGKIEGVISVFAGGSAWDYAPTNFLMKEAGAKIIHYDGKDEIDSRSFAVLSPKLYNDLADDLKQVFNNA